MPGSRLVLALLGAVGSVVAVGGCAGLIVRDTNSVPAKTGKVLARTLLCLSTYCISEFVMDDVKAADAERQGRAWIAANVGLMELRQRAQRVRPAHIRGRRRRLVHGHVERQPHGYRPIGDSVASLHHGYRLQLNFDAATKVLRAGQLNRW